MKQTKSVKETHLTHNVISDKCKPIYGDCIILPVESTNFTATATNVFYVIFKTPLNWMSAQYTASIDYTRKTGTAFYSESDILWRLKTESSIVYNGMCSAPA